MNVDHHSAGDRHIVYLWRQTDGASHPTTQKSNTQAPDAWSGSITLAELLPERLDQTSNDMLCSESKQQPENENTMTETNSYKNYTYMCVKTTFKYSYSHNKITCHCVSTVYTSASVWQLLEETKWQRLPAVGSWPAPPHM